MNVKGRGVSRFLLYIMNNSAIATYLTATPDTLHIIGKVIKGSTILVYPRHAFLLHHNHIHFGSSPSTIQSSSHSVIYQIPLSLQDEVGHFPGLFPVCPSLG